MDEAAKGTGKPPDYYSYLLRLWREGEGGRGWRASLHDPHTGQRVGFGSLEELFSFLKGQVGFLPDNQGGEEGR